MATKTKSKRMSHANCTHPKTSNERAKCRSRRNSPPITVAAESKPSISQLASMLSDSLNSMRLAEQRAEYHQAEAASIQEQLTRSMLDREPSPTSDGRPPVVAFSKRFREGAKAYSYVAIGVPVAYDNHRLDHHGLVVDTNWVTQWYISSSSGRSASPKSWQQLIEFMGVDGLNTLEVLRAG